MVADPADFFALDPVALSRLEGLGKKSATKLIKTIEVSLLLDISNLAHILMIIIIAVFLTVHSLLEKYWQKLLSSHYRYVQKFRDLSTSTVGS